MTPHARILCGLLILLSGMGEARETVGQKAIKEAGDRWVPCLQLYGSPGHECRVNGSAIEVRLPCEQRMREAMQNADGFLKHGPSDTINALQSPIFWTVMKQWQQTMKECVP